MQHEPALELRPINADGTDWEPPQHDPRYLYAELVACHKRETYHGKNGAFKIGSDRWEIDKMRRREKKKSRPKRKWGSAKFAKRKTAWGKRTLRSKSRLTRATTG